MHACMPVCVYYVTKGNNKLFSQNGFVHVMLHNWGVKVCMYMYVCMCEFMRVCMYVLMYVWMCVYLTCELEYV
jgi:hypothetical protein